MTSEYLNAIHRRAILRRFVDVLQNDYLALAGSIPRRELEAETPLGGVLAVPQQAIKDEVLALRQQVELLDREVEQYEVTRRKAPHEQQRSAPATKTQHKEQPAAKKPQRKPAPR